jgi:hypothetical protein
LYAFLSDNFREAFYHLLPACMKSADVVRPALRYELTTLKSSFRHVSLPLPEELSHSSSDFSSKFFSKKIS